MTKVQEYHWPKPAEALKLLARDVKEDQWLRELVENGLAAGASQIAIDAYLDQDTGLWLTRVSDNGQGMSPNELERRLKDLGDPKRTENFGIGGRVSTLAYNSAGVIWVSRTAGHAAAMIRGRENGLELFAQEDGRFVSVVEPDPKMLPKWIGQHGTAVILCGDGKTSTWAKNPYAWGKELARRYWTFGNTTVQVANWRDKGRGLQNVPPFHKLLERHSVNTGNVILSDGTRIDWHIIKVGEEQQRFKSTLIGGLAVRHGNELYDWADARRFARFGLYSRPAQARTVLIINPPEGMVHPTAARSRLVRIAGNKDLPWEDWATDFVQQLPDALKELLPKSLAVIDFTRLQEAFGKDWRMRIAPTIHGVKTSSAMAEQAAETGKRFDAELQPIKLEKELSEQSESEKENPSERPKSEVERHERQRREVEKGNGNAHGRFASRADLPEVIPLGPDDWRSEIPEFDFEYNPTGQRTNGSVGPVLYMKTTGYAILRQTEHWARLRPDIDSDVIATIVQESYAFEAIAKIVHMFDAFYQRPGWIGDIDDILSPRNLTFSVLGFLTLDSFIEDGIRKYQTGIGEAEQSAPSSPLFDHLM